MGIEALRAEFMNDDTPPNRYDHVILVGRRWVRSAGPSINMHIGAWCFWVL
jgi:hypothetical protein